MSRSVPEWIGKNHDTPIPPRVKVRIFEQCNGHCRSCGRAVVGGTIAAYDHTIALINGGENRESNIQLLCHECHSQKTGQDIHTKVSTYRKRLRHLGIKRKHRLIPGSKGSGYRRKMDGTTIKVDE